MSSTVSSHHILAQVRQLLEGGDAEKALQLVERTGFQTPELKNALGVCLLRLGKVEKALNVLQEVVFQKFMCIPKGTPPLYQANYATALLLKDYNQMAIEIINSLSPSDHPYIAGLYETIAQWKKKLPLHQKIRCMLKLYPATRVSLTMRPGEV